MLDLLRYLGSDRIALAGVFILVIAVGTIAVAAPAWSQSPTQEQEATAIEEENARAGMRGGRAGMAGPQSGMMGRRGAMPGAMHGMRGGRPGAVQGRRAAGPMGARRGPAGLSGGRFDLASRALGRAEEISLTDVQKQGIEEARDAHRRQQVEHEASMKLAGLDMAELLRDDSADLTAIEQKMSALAELRVQEQMAALRYRRSVQGILSAEQIEQLRDFSDRAERRGPRDDRTPRTRTQR